MNKGMLFVFSLMCSFNTLASQVYVEAHLSNNRVTNAAFSGDVELQQNGCIDLYSVIPDAFRTHTDLTGNSLIVTFRVAAKFSKPTMVTFATPGFMNEPVGEPGQRQFSYTTPWGATHATTVDNPRTGAVFRTVHGMTYRKLNKPVPGCSGVLYTLENVAGGKLIALTPGRDDIDVEALPLATMFAAGERQELKSLPAGFAPGYKLHSKTVQIQDGEHYPFDIKVKTKDAQKRTQNINLNFFTYFEQSGFYHLHPLYQSMQGRELDIRINGKPLKVFRDVGWKYTRNGSFYVSKAGWYHVSIKAELKALKGQQSIAWSRPTFKHNGGYSGRFRLILQTPGGTEFLTTERMYVRTGS